MQRQVHMKGLKIIFALAFTSAAMLSGCTSASTEPIPNVSGDAVSASISPTPAAAASPAASPTPSPQAHASNSRSGVYSSLVLGIDPQTKELTGFYSNGTGEAAGGGPAFTCEFFMKGVPVGDEYTIVTWFPGEKDIINGTLSFHEKGDARSVELKLDSDPPGCANVAELTKGESAQLTKPGDWQAVRIVSADKAFFYDAADAPEKTAKFVVKNDVVRVIRSGIERSEVEFVKDKTTKGWLRNQDLFPADPR